MQSHHLFEYLMVCVSWSLPDFTSVGTGEMGRDLHILLLVTASGSIILSVETSNLKRNVTKAGEPGNKASPKHLSEFCCSQPFIVMKF